MVGGVEPVPDHPCGDLPHGQAPGRDLQAAAEVLALFTSAPFVSLQVDNTKFTMDCVVPTIHVYEHHENKWRCRDPH